MIRILCSLAVAAAAVGTATPAHAYTPIPYAKVKDLAGKQVYAAASVELSRKGPVWIYAGEPVTLVECAKTTSTVSHDKVKITGWGYSRCTVTAADGTKGTVQFGKLSLDPLKYNLREPGTPAKLRRAAFDEAYDTAMAMVKFAKAHETELGSDLVTSKLDGADVLGEYHAQWFAMNAAQEDAKKLHREMVMGSRLTTESAMRMPEHGWAVHASDKDMLQAWTRGLEDAAAKKKADPQISCLGNLNGVSGWGVMPGNIADEIAAKGWRRGVKGVSDDQLADLDKENEARLNKRLADNRKAFQKQLKAAEALHKKLKW